jgi:hypothetical protein
MSKTVYICIASGGGGRITVDRKGSTRATHCAVEQVPDKLPVAAVILHLSTLVLYPWPTKLVWRDVADLPAGRLVKMGAPRLTAQG